MDISAKTDYAIRALLYLAEAAADGGGPVSVDTLAVRQSLPRKFLEAIFADLVATASRVDQRHVKGVNVLYGDGSATWVDRSTFNEPLAQCTKSPDAATNPFQDEIWKSFDR